MNGESRNVKISKRAYNISIYVYIERIYIYYLHADSLTFKRVHIDINFMLRLLDISTLWQPPHYNKALQISCLPMSSKTIV